MIEFDAIYFDGKTSARTPVRVRGNCNTMHVVGAGVSMEVALREARADSPVLDTRRSIHLPDGSQLRTDDHVALDALFPRGNRLETWVHALERRWGYALTAIAVIAGFSLWCVVYGLPLAATAAAELVPATLEAELGEQTLNALDKSLCSASAIAPHQRHAVEKSFETLTAGLDDGYAYRLELRACRAVGPNAFALPGGTIVVTDDLVALAHNDQQVAAVIAHEMGHVLHRHGLRLALQMAGAAALVATLAGDAVSITSLAAVLPTALLESGYSREFETEADTYAFRRLKEVGSSPRYFAEIMTLLEQTRDKRNAAQGEGKRGESPDTSRSSDYLSTHPDTARRIRRALADQ